jgi:ribulose-5-phosphate 4-epimerase/fuculose-1-phosphate aldolase
MSWESLRPSLDRTHHRRSDAPAYEARFDEVLPFHMPGLAPVRRGVEAWHIDARGRAAYARRFHRTFGFYEGLAAVVGPEGWHHITPDGADATAARYAWCGNYQGGRCPVRDAKQRYFHIDRAGLAVYTARWRYAGDFREGVAVIQADDGRSTHLDEVGAQLHGRWFVDLDVFHKGLARARDDDGWTHVDHRGEPVYTRRFAQVEPFYNGQARVERFDGGLEVIDETGRTMVTLRGAQGIAQAAPTGERRAREELVRVARLIYERGYNVSIDGNLSYRLDDGTLLMTPSGSHNGFLDPEDLVVTQPDGTLLRGSRPPTSEYRLHVELHRVRPDCRCVIHVHAPYALAADLAGIDLHQAWITAAPVPTTHYARISSEQSPAVLRPFMEDYNWAILPRHGVVTWADTVWNAFLRVEGLEHYAKIVVTARACGPADPLSDDKRDELLAFWNLEHLARRRP